MWIFGGLALAAGTAFTQVADMRVGACFVTFLDALVVHWPEGGTVLTLDNLSTHRAMDIRL